MGLIFLYISANFLLFFKGPRPFKSLKTNFSGLTTQYAPRLNRGPSAANISWPTNAVKKSAKHCLLFFLRICFIHIARGKLMKFLPAIVPIPGRFFFIISILKQTSRYRRQLRVGTSRYCDDLYNVLPAIVFFAAERPRFNLGAF
jgi:hypothetical protein